MSGAEDVHRDIGRHEAEISAVRREIEGLRVENRDLWQSMQALRSESREMREDLHAIREVLSEAKGGWKMLMAVGGFSAACGAVLSQAWEWIERIPR